MNTNKRKEVVKGFFTGDTVILKKETKFSKEQGFKLGDVGIVSKNDNEESLEGWEVFNYTKQIEETLENFDSNQIENIFSKIVNILGEKEIEEILKNINLNK